MPFTISSLKVRLHLNLSDWQLCSPFQSKNNYFMSNFMQNLTTHFGNIKSWYNYSTTMFAKYTLTNQMVLHQLKLELFEEKFIRVSSIFQNVQFFFIWSWLKIVLVNWFHIIISIQVLVLQGSLTKNMVAWLRYLWHVSVAKVSFFYLVDPSNRFFLNHYLFWYHIYWNIITFLKKTPKVNWWNLTKPGRKRNLEQKRAEQSFCWSQKEKLLKKSTWGTNLYRYKEN